MADFHAQGDSNAEDRGQEEVRGSEQPGSGPPEVKFGDAGDAKMLSFDVTHVCHEAARCGEAHHREGERGTQWGRELDSECERRQDSKEEEGRVSRDQTSRSTSTRTK